MQHNRRVLRIFLPPRSVALFAWIRRRAVAAIGEPQRHLRAAENVFLVFHSNAVAKAGEALEQVRAVATLETNAQILKHMPAWRIDCGLGVLLVATDTQHHLHVPLRLHVATHHTEAHQWFIGKVGEKTRDDRLKRTFAWCHLIGMPVFQHKSVAAILQ